MKFKLLLLVLAHQTARPLAIVAMQEYGFGHGKATLIEAQSMEPRYKLNGDYLMPRCKISDAPANLASPPVKIFAFRRKNLFRARTQHE